MYPRKILEYLTFHQITEISKSLEKYFPVHYERIVQLILQVDSLDETLRLLCIHKECDTTMDRIVYEYLRGQDDK